MRKVEIELTEQQEKFLKMFAEKHYDGAKDNLYTCNAIHVVETNRPIYIPYHGDQVDYFGDLPMIFTADSDYELWHDSEVELVEQWYEVRDEIPPFYILPFEDVQYKSFYTMNGDDIFVVDYEDYFQLYDIPFHRISWLQENYEPVAYFFILDEAKRYIEYQRHNLRNPRTYTYSSGYANYGDFDHFRNLMLSIGTKLNSQSE